MIVTFSDIKYHAFEQPIIGEDNLVITYIGI